MKGVLEQRSALATTEQARQKQRLAQLQREQDKILRLHYDDIIPVEKVREKQQRIARESEDAIRIIDAASVEASLVMDNLDAILSDLSEPQRVYIAADPRTRRHMNQAFFEAIRIDVAGQAEPQITETYATVLTEGLVNELERELKNPDQCSIDRGSKAV